ncbi:MAG TPA: glycosyltransferase, partial [Acidimicrobiia bacterium]|nr:glycosyltransferase [Acidimicrobiia bacterium]
LTAQLRRSLVVVHSRGSGPSSLERGTPLACSYPVIDGMSSGCAIVTDAARGAHEYMVASGAGIDLDDHPERLVTAVTDLMRNPDTARALGERAYRFAAEHFAPGRVACEVNALMASSDRRR